MEVRGELHVPSALPPPIFIGLVAGWAPEPVLDAVAKIKKFFHCPSRGSNPGRPVRSSLKIDTEGYKNVILACVRSVRLLPIVQKIYA